MLLNKVHLCSDEDLEEMSKVLEPMAGIILDELVPEILNEKID